MATRNPSSTRLSAKGQVVIPKSVREERGWGPGLELLVEVSDGGVVLRPRAITRARAAAELLGCTGYTGRRRTLKEMQAAVAREAKSRK